MTPDGTGPDLPTHVFEGHALWPQSPWLPLRVRRAVDALAASLQRRVALPPGV